MIKVACPSCAKTLRFQEKHLGRKIHCPECGHPQVLGQSADPDNDATQGPPAGSQLSSTPKAGNRSQSFATQMPPTMAIDNVGSDRRKPIAFAGSFLAPPEAADEIGRLGGYRILSQLGAGGMGVVFLAEDAKLNRKIAVKALPPDAIDDPAARDRFKREAQVAANLEHENIVTIYQVDEDRGVMFLAMQLLKGQPLDQYLSETQGQPLRVDEVLQIGREIAAGLAAAHDQNLIHRDIKPANVWLEDLASRGNRQRFRVKILDFGLARRTYDASLTQSGIIVGTPSYMSPEQARGPKVDGRSDIFSLGCVLYECATGRRPFAGNDAISVLSSLAADAPVPPAELNPEISFELSDFILELLEKNPANRPATAREVEDRLHEFSAGATDSSTNTERLSVSTLRTPRRKADSSRLWIWIGVGSSVGCLILSLGVWAMVTSSPPPVVKEKAAILKKDVKDVKDVKAPPKEVQVIPQLPPFQPAAQPPFPPPPFQPPDDEIKKLKDREKELNDFEKMLKDKEKEWKEKDKKDWKEPKDGMKKGPKKGFEPLMSFNEFRPREMTPIHFVSRQLL